MDDLPKRSTFWRKYKAAFPDRYPSSASGWATFLVQMQGQDALLATLDSEQIEIGERCKGFQNPAFGTDRYDLVVIDDVGFIDQSKASCAPCWTNPNGDNCQWDCIKSTSPSGTFLNWPVKLEIGEPVPILYRNSGGQSLAELDNLIIRFEYLLVDLHVCIGEHSHQRGSFLHESSWDMLSNSDQSPWYFISALRDGTAPTPPAEPPSADEQLRRLQAALDDAATSCPTPSQELTDLFTAFTAVEDSTDAAGKAVSSVQLRSWGAIKNLIDAEGD